MAENNKKRAGSFRKLFPNLFFSHKSKEKHVNKDSQSTAKSATEFSKGNQYQNPRSIRCDKNGRGLEDSERIYENLTTHRPQTDNEIQSNDISSHHSSSSTLVSESTKNKSIDTNGVSEVESFAYTNYAARPQVPPKPYNEMAHSPNSPNQNTNQENKFDNTQYPDVYYHSLEKLTDKISPFDEIEIYRASQAQANPASVGAEIKRVSTKFLISPKKEAEVRTIMPTRARSLSFDNNNKENEQDRKTRDSSKKPETITKPYNYSAPTSPMPINHKIPNMPKTVSPYEHVRKIMIETEQKRNSLSRTSLRTKSPSSPRSEYSQRMTPTLQENSKQESIDKEKTRQKVEAFYWQKLKELKLKEDEYLTRQSLTSSLKSSPGLKTSGDQNSSTANSFSYVIEPRSCSLPRGNDLKSYSMNQPIYTSVPFNRGAPERRTDTFIKSRPTFDDPEIIYRHPEKLTARTTSPLLQNQKMPIYYRGTIPQDNQNLGQSKRVSFEDRYGKTVSGVKSAGELKFRDVQNRPPSNNKVSALASRVPPRPPVRTTSVGGVGRKIAIDKKSLYSTSAGHSLCSESESGSEAGEIQRIMQTNAQKVNMFANKVVLVTGGSSGIGAATVEQFAKEGAAVAFVGRNETKLHEVSKRCEQYKVKTLAIKADVSKEEQARTIVQQTVDEFKKLDVLVNNAGILRFATLEQPDLLKYYDEVMNTNLRSVVQITNLAIPHLVKTKGNIINVSSVASTSYKVPGLSAYSISKAGMDHFTRCAAMELAPSGVRVNCVNPGPVVTEIIANANVPPGFVGTDPGQMTALGRYSDAVEVADLILYLASDKAKSITGVCSVIDNGFLVK